MKRRVAFLLSLLLGATVLLVVGQGSVSAGGGDSVESSPVSLRVVQGRLVFAGKEDFVQAQHFLNDLSAVQIDEWEESIGFYSLRRYRDDLVTYKETEPGRVTPSSTGDVYLDSVLSPRSTVQIGNRIFRLDMPKGKVHVLSAKDRDQIKTFEVDISKARNVASYPTDVDLLDDGDPILEEKAILCRETGMGGRKDARAYFYLFPKTDIRVYCEAEYVKAGIWFSLNTKIVHEGLRRGRWYELTVYPEMQMGFNYISSRYKPRCEKESSTYESSRYFTTTKIVRRPYYGTKPLNKAYLTAQYYWRERDGDPWRTFSPVTVQN